MSVNDNREEILRVEHLKEYFKSGSGKNKLVVKAVDDISFTIYKGEVFSLVGESGCGKTTTARTIIKLYKATAGEVYFHGTRIISDVKAAKKEHKKSILKLRKNEADEITKLDLKLENDKISAEEYKELKSETKKKYSNELEKLHEVLRAAKRDAKFESITDKDGKKARKHLEDLPEFLKIQEKYKKANKVINDKIVDYKQKKETGLNSDIDYSKEITKLYKEIKLNEIRKKQDISKMKFMLVKKNKILMREMQMIFQDPISSLNPRMTVKEIIAEGLRINGVRNEMEINEEVDKALRTVGLVPEHASRYPHEFSGGQRQRIGIARALIVNPSFIIADEPVSALDVSIRAQVINLLNDLREEKGITIMFIAHDLSVVKYFSDRLAVMYFGHIVEIGDKNKLFNHPLHPYTNSLMDSIPLPDPDFEKRRKKRPRYNPAKEHDYSKESPTLREVEPEHFVLCNTDEFNAYQEKLKNIKQ